MVGWFVGV